jgi:hypothetical protein
VAESLAAHVAPDGAAVAPERLRKGETVRVVDGDPDSGWLTIEPPASAFGWVERRAVRIEGPGIGRVIAPKAVVRAGVPDARMPGPPGTVLDRGVNVRLLNRPELTVGTGQKATTWLAIAPTPGEVRYVRAAGVALKTSEPPLAAPEPPRETRAAFVDEPKPSAGPALPLSIAAEVARIEAEHRAALSEPVERWKLDAVRARYQSLLDRVTDPGAAEALRDRLELVGRQEALARSARVFQTLVERSRRRDQDVAMTRRRLAEVDRPQRRPFVAEGLIQASSREVDGRRVYALIGPEGNPIAYLDVPPGLDARPALAKRVGVRGSIRYNENLGARLIAVRELEPLE